MPAKGQDKMQTSILLAKLIGPLLLAMAAVMVANPRGFRAVVDDFTRSPALFFLSGVLTLVAGLAILHAHNVWVFDTGAVWIFNWRSIITIVGWIAVLGGLARMLLVTQLASWAAGFNRHAWIGQGIAIVAVIFGAILTFKGYMT
ncbi:MAG: hypothetical protein QOD40_1154 [Alphaproteobacteria bacterium]|jgi:hypothetical protein|nr:hypothetical protein [Alphaproteobacteria bacterium]